MRFLTTNDIETWADTVDCKYHLPHLIRKLILATLDNNSIKHIHFPYGDILPNGRKTQIHESDIINDQAAPAGLCDQIDSTQPRYKREYGKVVPV